MNRLVIPFLALSLIPLAARAEILRAELQVNGMACPFCAFGIEKKLRAVEGVREVDVLLDQGLLQLTFSPANRATVRDLDEAVARAGFSLAGLHLAVRGAFEPDAARPVLDTGEFRLLLIEERDGAVHPITEKERERLTATAGDTGILVEGEVRGYADPIPGLVIRQSEATR